MAVQFAQIEEKWYRLRNYLLGDLSKVTAQPTGGNFAAALLIMCGYEILARLKKKKDDEFFAEEIVQDNPIISKSTARIIYKRLRNGLVHLYDAPDILVNGRRIELALSWGVYPHLSFDASIQRLYLNIQTMASNLENAFDCFEHSLRENWRARELFYTVATLAPFPVTSLQDAREWEDFLLRVIP